MTKEELKQYIDQNIYENVDGDISGDSLNEVLKAIVDDGGTEVEANPNGEATEILESIGINGVKYSIKDGGTEVEANPTGEATEILGSIGINGVKYSIKESEEYDETQLMPNATWYNKSLLDSNGDAGINVFSSQNQTDGHYSSMYEINIAGYSKIKITAPSVGSYISITKKKLPYGQAVRGNQMVSDYIELCPGFTPNNGSAADPKTRMAISANQTVEITLTPDAKYLYALDQFANYMSHYYPTSVVGFMAKKEEQVGGSHNVGLEIHSGDLAESTGLPVESQDSFYTSPISLDAGFFIRLREPYRVKRCVLYDKENNMVDYYDHIGSNSVRNIEWGLKVFLPQYYARLVIQPDTENSDRLKQDEIVEKFVMLDDKRLNRESPINTGAFPITLANWKLFQRRLSQVMNPVWLALKKIPNWTESYFKAMTENRGVPYTEANEYSKFVGEQVSFRTFMTSLLNKRSVIYTEKIGANAAGPVQSKYGIGYHGMYQASSAYYGTVCTGFTSYLIGFTKIISSGVWGDVNGMEPIARGYYDNSDESTRWQLYQNGNYVACTKDDVWEAMKTMDFIWNTGHCSVISDIYSDEYGDKELVVWTEQTTPRGKMTPFSKEGILNRLLLITETENTDSDSLNGHKYWVLYRYSKWANMGDNAVNFEEDADTPYIQTKFSDYSPKPLTIDPDIQICLGDYPAIACTDGAFQQTIPFCFNVHRGGEYTTLQIFNESDNVESSNPIATIDISSNVSGQIYNSTDIESDDAEDKDDWIVVDMRNITLGTTLTSGKYKARVTDGTGASGFTHFELVDISEFSYNPQTTTVEFSTESGTPYLVRLETNAGLSRGSWDLTQQDVINGSKTLTGINPTTDNHILKIFVKGDYGVVTKSIDLNQ